MSTLQVPSSAIIQRAVHKTLASLTPALRHLVKSLEIPKHIRRASDETLERIQYTGEFALCNCLLEYVCRSPADRPCGYFKVSHVLQLSLGNELLIHMQTVQSEIFSTTSLALLVARSDLEIESAPRTATQIVHLIFGVLSRDLGVQRLQDAFDLLFGPLVRAADAAYLACCDK
jgi:hypothetical protein